jgi:hypothetical protein
MDKRQIRPACEAGREVRIENATLVRQQSKNRTSALYPQDKSHIQLPVALERDYAATCHRWQQARQHIALVRRLVEAEL